MTEKELFCRLTKDLSRINMPVDEVEISIRPYSKTYYGRYFPKSSRLFIYPYADDNLFMSYEKILINTIHEMCHHIQYTDPNFIRIRGIMHNPQFWRLYNHYISRAYILGIISEVGNEKEAYAVI